MKMLKKTLPIVIAAALAAMLMATSTWAATLTDDFDDGFMDWWELSGDFTDEGVQKRGDIGKKQTGGILSMQ
jgi:hypothetical protein